ncbi:MAG: DUF6122 family protein [Bacteroidota bacterium]
MFHLLLHLLVPLAVGWLFYRPAWRSAVGIMIATMIVDIDHLIADPMYDPNRCSIEFHPLHTVPAIVVYALCFAVPLVLGRSPEGLTKKARWIHLAGLGLLIHMGLDWIDCF